MLGVLNAYWTSDDAPQYQRDYGPMMLQFLASALPGEVIREYKIALGEWPKELNECDSYLITGSSLGAYDEIHWIRQLAEFIRQCHTSKKKLIGICFGHQIIAHSLGGLTEKSPKGWGVGLKSFDVTTAKPWMSPERSKLSLLFSHQDQVVKLPPEAELLAKSEFCSIQMYSIGEHIFCLQGHPEFTVEFAKARMDTRIDEIGKSIYNEAVKSLSHSTHSQVLGKWLRKFLL